MEVGDKIVKEAMRSLQAQEDLKTDVINQKGRISIESQSLALINKEGQLLDERLSQIQTIIRSLQGQEQFLRATRDSYTRAQLWRSYFKKFISAMDPNDEERTAMINEYQSRYATLVQKYELKPEYQQILEAENTKSQLTERISELRNGLMRLETEREY